MTATKARAETAHPSLNGNGGGRTTKCPCGGRYEPRVLPGGAVVDRCTDCGKKPEAYQPLTRLPDAAALRALSKCTVKGCPGLLDANDRCSCCAKREAWREAHMPNRRCEICEGEIQGRRNMKYCAACKPLAQRAQIAAHDAQKKKRG